MYTLYFFFLQVSRLLPDLSTTWYQPSWPSSAVDSYFFFKKQNKHCSSQKNKIIKWHLWNKVHRILYSGKQYFALGLVLIFSSPLTCRSDPSTADLCHNHCKSQRRGYLLSCLFDNLLLLPCADTTCLHWEILQWQSWCSYSTSNPCLFIYIL